MGATNTPLLRVEVVGARSEVLDETKGQTVKSDKNGASRRTDANGLAAQIGKGLLVGELGLGESVATEQRTHGQRMGGDPVAPLELSQLHTFGEYSQVLAETGKQGSMTDGEG